MAKARRTTNRSSKGEFKDIQTYKRAHAADLRAGTTASEAAAAAKVATRKKAAKKKVGKKVAGKKVARKTAAKKK